MTHELLARMWSALSGPVDRLDAIEITGPDHFLPAVYDVTELAASSVASACAAVAELGQLRGSEAGPIRVDRRLAGLAFAAEALFQPEGWQRPAVWDPLAGDYRCSDGWIRLHTNYSYHRAAVENVLTGVSDRESVATAVASRAGADLEAAVVEAGGCAAVMHDRAAWLATPAGTAAQHEPLLGLRRRPVAGAGLPLGRSVRPLSGVRVLDLTRVIAGPIATRFLAAYGADVLRIDPPGFVEVGALLPETTAGKRCAALDLHNPDDRTGFDALVRGAHVLVSGLRGDALAGAGYDEATLHSLNPDLIDIRLDAYGWTGPWANRRGFDSLVQMSCGIAAAGAEALGQDAPKPLPVQALDHATGYLIAAAVARAVSELIRAGRVSSVRASLVATAALLGDFPLPGGLSAASPQPSSALEFLEPAHTAWGPGRRVPVPGQIEGIPARLNRPSGPLGRDAPEWT